MLQRMNECIKGWVAGVIVAMVGATFVFWGLSSYVGRSTGADATVAKVNGYKITERDFMRQYSQMKKAYLQQTGASALQPEAVQQLKEYLLQQIIMQRALLQRAKKLGFSISIAQVQQLLMQDPAFQVDGKFSQQRLQLAMYNGGAQSTAEFFSRVQEDVLVNQVSGNMQSTSFILPDELAMAYGLIHQTRDFGYFAMQVASFVPTAKVSSEEIKSFYDSNKSQYKTPQQVSFDYLLLDPKVVSKTVTVSPEDIQQYYDDHRANYSAEKRWKVSVASIKLDAAAKDATKQEAVTSMSKLSKALTTSADFAALAKQNGAEFISEWLVASNKTVSVSVLESLKPGIYSSPIQTSQGLIIVRLDQVQPASTQSLDDVKDKISAMLISQKLEQVMASETEQLSNLTYTDPDSLSPAAKKLNLTINHTELMPSKGVDSGVFSDAKVLQAAFGDEVLKQSYNSNPVVLKGGVVVILRRNKVVPSSLLSLDTVSSKIKDQLANQKAEQMAGVQAYKIQQDLQAGANPPSLAKKYHLTWVSKTKVAREDKQLPAQLVSTVFATELYGHGQKGYNSLLVDNKTYYVLMVMNWHNAAIATVSDKDLSALQKNLAHSVAQFDYAAYVKTVRDQSKIKIYKKALAEVS